MKRIGSVLGIVALVAAGVVVTPSVASADRGGRPAQEAFERLARKALAPGDGWGAAGASTTGGSAVDRRDVVTVGTRDELAAAVAGDEPKIVIVSGVIDANTDAAGDPLTCADYQRDGYTLESYLATYDPAVWGRDDEPSGPVEDARAASQRAQAERVTIRVGSNTTIIGRDGAGLTGAYLRVDKTSNVIIRGLTLTDTFDCFPAWDPTDGSAGNWNSNYDTLSLTGATNVWIDHNEFSDGDNLDSQQPEYFGRKYQVHDGALDITNASDLVTVSYNRFLAHDKAMLIGSSDSRTTDRGTLRVTIHHNEFRDMGQRVPRVRYGQVDVYNNHYVQTAGAPLTYQYSWGVGVESQIVAERNAFTVTDEFPIGEVIGAYKGTDIVENDNLVNGEPVDLLAASNAANATNLGSAVTWTPSLRRTVHPTVSVPRVVTALAGPDGIDRTERIVVDAEGDGDSTTVQGAIDLAPTASADRVEIVIGPGTYREVVNVPASHERLTLRGATGDPRDVKITYDNAAGTPKPGGGTWGTTGSATATLKGADFEARDITFENAFDEAAHPEITSRQAVAVKTQGDRMVFDNCRLIGNQDTLYLDSLAADTRARVYISDSWIEGDVDFIFGRATAVIEDSTVKSLARDSDPSGYVTAPSTSSDNPYGFLITRSRLISNARDGSVFLGRPWHPSSAPDNNPRVVVRDSWLGRHIIAADPWTTMSGYDWTPGSNAEFRNGGPGAKKNAERPQLTREQARANEVADYLAGDDGWAPQER